ncbi:MULTISPECIES: amino acid ABC transporter permease [Rhodococcus]|uniref:Glutamate ABC transporter permease n=4 Tax=Rhodococcus TaxID=1827 RepID=V9XBQ6_9NOCA|nr:MULTISPECIES: amino acid ABC transporter permease [Rhodococcus]AHD19474.1 glutamate ABC transporter permease [Rhodococcus pyridinivorans SB3094]AWZ24859.1 amino acid ABC transporter permease [Rhodococcus pyridinivorans]EHK84540.1 glutamate ABC transporter permease protein [Rhodococcus pyridinivorans AK37]KHJ70767.1 glutamate ABC transporter permease [Rhodococcus sp. Chr-9]MBX4167358.1 amino acid ABC transporter permease [Rhodococcus sp. DMU2021]
MSAHGTVLYDAPGPRAKALYRILSVVVVALLVLVGWIVYRALDANGQLTAAKWEPFVESSSWTTYLLPGIRGTIIAAVASIVLALVLGTVLGIARLSDHRWVRWIAGTIVELFRAVPVLILMIFAYQVFAEYRVFKSGYLALAAVITGLTLYNGSVIAEIVRAGIRSLPRGQSEAAYAIGMRKNQLMRLILLPQAVTVMLPAIVSQMVIALKDSALGYLIGYVEVVRSGQQLGAFFQNYLPSLLVVAAIMIILNSALTQFAIWLEKRLRSGKRKKGAVAAEEPQTMPTMSVPGLDLSGEGRK